MANYTKSTNFAVKDTLTTGDPQKIVSGVEIDTEFVNISSMSSTKMDKVGGATAGNVATLTAGGAVQDSGESLAAIQQSITDAEYDSDDLKTDLNASGNAPLYALRAWASFVTDGTINGSGNIDSVTRNAAGTWTVNFSTDMEDANYSVSISQGPQDRESLLMSRSVSSFVVVTERTETEQPTDTDNVTIMVVR